MDLYSLHYLMLQHGTRYRAGGTEYGQRPEDNCRYEIFYIDREHELHLVDDVAYLHNDTGDKTNRTPDEEKYFHASSEDRSQRSIASDSSCFARVSALDIDATFRIVFRRLARATTELFSVFTGWIFFFPTSRTISVKVSNTSWVIQMTSPLGVVIVHAVGSK
jgi:hypothetical protein